MGDVDNILLIGNGFDLAHGLPTSYGDFLYLMQNWDRFLGEYQYYRIHGKIDRYSEMKKYLDDKTLDDMNIQRLGKIIKSNSGAIYYQLCGAEIDGWIDFEREMYPVLDLFAQIFEAPYVIQDKEENSVHGTARISVSDIDQKNRNVTKLLPKYISDWNARFCFIDKEYATAQYGILKKKLLASLKSDLDEFIEALEIYLHEFVDNRALTALKQIAEIKADYVISFNYTLTERLYGVTDEDTHHIHGRIREHLSAGTNNMVLGVNERQNQNLDFIYFVKYFQRIQKKSGTEYKKHVPRRVRAQSGIVYRQPYQLHIYGHSLDSTDEDVIKYVIGDMDENGIFRLKANKVFIYYYNQADFEQKVINLIDLYGRSVVEAYMESGDFSFVPINDEMIML